jgi:GTPase SAR1 family protein
MSNRRKSHLDQLERRMTGAKRIGLFGHRAVGKTTLLAMFYREAAHGRVPGVRLAAVQAKTAEYLAEKIAQIESGEPPAGTLAETELSLRLYHGPARFDLIVKDYQGEHLTLGSEAPIHDFFADCDAVLLCLDPDSAAQPADRQRRQQEIEQLLERYIERSDDATAGRPVALVVTKYDQVLAAGGPSPDRVERLVDQRYGMTRHALARHAPRSAIFAVSSYGRDARGDKPPAELHPLGLEAPLAWLADQLEESDREQLDWLWDLAPDDRARLARCVRAFEKRYPRSDQVIDFRRRLNRLNRRHLRRSFAKLTAAAGLVAGCLAGYDAWGFHRALRFEREGNPAPAVERHWSNLLAWHPTLPYFWPQDAKRAAHQRDEWEVKAEGLRVVVGTDGPDAEVRLNALKEQAPDLVPAIRDVEQARRLALHDRRWKELRVAEVDAAEKPEETLLAVRAFLKEFPESGHRAELAKWSVLLNARATDLRDAADRQSLAKWRQAGALPDADLPDLIQQAKSFLDGHPESRLRPDVEELLAGFVRRLDESHFEKARLATRQYPTNFALRIRKYQEYLDAHRSGGQFVSEAMEAIDKIERERDLYMYRLAYDHFTAHTDDLSEVARRLRSYLEINPQGRRAPAAQSFLKWFEKASVPGQYHVTLRRGEVEPNVGKYLAGGGPDLGVEIWVAGVKYGPSPVVRNTHRPIWDYTFTRPITWKLGDPVVVRILDHDWSTSVVYTLSSPKNDPLAMKMLCGTVRPSKGGATRLVFSSDFTLPKLPKPEGDSM